MVHIVHTVHIIFTDTLYLKKSLLPFNNNIYYIIYIIINIKKQRKEREGMSVKNMCTMCTVCTQHSGFAQVTSPFHLRYKSVVNPF